VTVLFLYQWEALSEIISHVSVIINRHNFWKPVLHEPLTILATQVAPKWFSKKNEELIDWLIDVFLVIILVAVSISR
jgi:hypothetical protein